MTMKVELSAEMKKKIAAIQAGRPVPPTKTPGQTFTDQPKGK